MMWRCPMLAAALWAVAREPIATEPPLPYEEEPSWFMPAGGGCWGFEPTGESG